jgi:hypothetical protein
VKCFSRVHTEKYIIPSQNDTGTPPRFGTPDAEHGILNA